MVSGAIVSTRAFVTARMRMRIKMKIKAAADENQKTNTKKGAWLNNRTAFTVFESCCGRLAFL